MQGGPFVVVLGAFDLSLAKHSFVCAPQLALALLVCANCGELTELIGESWCRDGALGSEAWHLGSWSPHCERRPNLRWLAQHRPRLRIVLGHPISR